MRINSLAGLLVLSFPTMEERDLLISHLNPLMSDKRTVEPGGPNADIKKQLLQEDRSSSPPHLHRESNPLLLHSIPKI